MRTSRPNLSLVYFITVVIVLFTFYGCSGAGEDREPRGMIEPSTVLFDELQRMSDSNSDLALNEDTVESPIYHIIMDSNLGDSTSGGTSESDQYNCNGYLSSGCATLGSILMVCSELTAGETYHGYMSCLDSENHSSYKGTDQNPIHGSFFIEQDDFFKKAAQSATHLYYDSNLVALIKDIAQNADDNASENDVFLLISDLAIQSEGESNLIADALTKHVLSNKNLTLGLIGIQADYAGSIKNVPVSSVGIEPRRVLGTGRNTNEVYQKPLYVLFIGEPEHVLKVMNQFLEKCNNTKSLSRAGQVESLFYYGLSCIPFTEEKTGSMNFASAKTFNKPSVEFSGNIAKYGESGYDPKYVFDISDEVPENMMESIQSIPLAKVYAGARTTDEANVHISCGIPFQLIMSPSLEEDDAQFINGGKEFEFTENNPFVELYPKLLQCNMGTGENPKKMTINSWGDPAQNLIVLAQNPVFNRELHTIDVYCSLDTTQLALDEPQIFSVSVQPECMPDKTELKSQYNTSWLKDWTMDLAIYKQEWASKARLFTQATKTAYLAETFVNNLLDRKIDLNIAFASDEMIEYQKMVIFGVVMREQAKYYVANGTDDEENLGWAFSTNDIIQYNGAGR